MSVRLFDRRVPPLSMMDGRRRAWKVASGRFKVFGRQGEQHRVHVMNGMPLCDCTAARFARPCWHAALVLARLMREAA